MGLSLPFVGCDLAESDPSDVGKVIIIGAGAAGMAAGYLLQQRGVAFEILEASSTYGGRMKRTTTFANFPIPLGAEWIHTDPSILQEIVNDDSVNIDIQTTMYDPEVDYALFEGEEYSIRDIGLAEDSKFINATWFDFFEQYILPPVADRITYNAVVNAIDYSAETIQVQTQNQTYSADSVIITVPVKLLQNGAINFTPALPDDKQGAIDNVTVWSGFKAFIEFSEKLWPVAVELAIEPESAGQKLYFDASYGQNTNQQILGLFAVGKGALPYVQLGNADLIAYILNELDELSDGMASSRYVKHIFQNWDAEPFAKGAYVYDHEDWRTVRRLGRNIDNRLFFAGTSYTTGDDWGSVHNATRSARRAVDELLS